ncbi:hypothetical protein A5740_17315 [Mycobacterium sp. GA-1841]|nr:hypothetical protein A5740_17315 [Mycobacterium sp. GA-1841]
MWGWAARFGLGKCHRFAGWTIAQWLGDSVVREICIRRCLSAGENRAGGVTALHFRQVRLGLRKSELAVELPI